MRHSLQTSLPPMAVEPVDRSRATPCSQTSPDLADRSTEVDRWLAFMNQAIEESGWKLDALAAHMGMDKAYLSRLRSGEKPWRVEHVCALPNDIEARFEELRAESFGLIVVAPAVDRQSATEQLVAGIFGLLNQQRTA